MLLLPGNLIALFGTFKYIPEKIERDGKKEGNREQDP